MADFVSAGRRFVGDDRKEVPALRQWECHERAPWPTDTAIGIAIFRNPSLCESLVLSRICCERSACPHLPTSRLLCAPLFSVLNADR
jgi:hypothetical protein